jgi:hypothetical protein
LLALADQQLFLQEWMMHGDRAPGDTQKLELPPDLIAELQRRGSGPKVDMQMDHWKPSLLSRMLEMFSGRRSG